MNVEKPAPHSTPPPSPFRQAELRGYHRIYMSLIEGSSPSNRLYSCAFSSLFRHQAESLPASQRIRCFDPLQAATATHISIYPTPISLRKRSTCCSHLPKAGKQRVVDREAARLLETLCAYRTSASSRLRSVRTRASTLYLDKRQGANRKGSSRGGCPAVGGGSCECWLLRG